MTRVMGVVAEGPTDHLVLERIADSVAPGAFEFLRLHPDSTPTLGTGWPGVRAWCREFGPVLHQYMTVIPSRRIDLLLLHLDCSMAREIGAKRKCPPAGATADALAEAVLGWLGLEIMPTFVALATPSQSSDTWVAAAVNPAVRSAPDLECSTRHAKSLRHHGLKLKNNRIKKSVVTYAPLATETGLNFGHVRAACTLADRLALELARLAALP